MGAWPPWDAIAEHDISAGRAVESSRTFDRGGVQRSIARVTSIRRRAPPQPSQSIAATRISTSPTG